MTKNKTAARKRKAAEEQRLAETLAEYERDMAKRDAKVLPAGQVVSFEPTLADEYNHICGWTVLRLKRQFTHGEFFQLTAPLYLDFMAGYKQACSRRDERWKELTQEEKNSQVFPDFAVYLSQQRPDLFEVVESPVHDIMVDDYSEYAWKQAEESAELEVSDA
jgi:L-rhamnose mutarotase